MEVLVISIGMRSLLMTFCKGKLFGDTAGLLDEEPYFFLIPSIVRLVICYTFSCLSLA
jgi:hypothetical protein